MSLLSSKTSPCYGIRENNPFAAGDQVQPCGDSNTQGFTQCCLSGDSCHPGGFCHYTGTKVNGSGWYLGGCTDPSYKDPSCPKPCRELADPDVIYNHTINLWACCRKDPSDVAGDPDCSNPGQIRFEGSRPEIIVAQQFSSPSSAISALNNGAVSSGADFNITSSASSTPSATELSTSQSGTTSTASPTTTPQTPGSAGLSLGVIAGIGLSAAFLFVLLLCALAWLIIRRKHKKQSLPPISKPCWDGKRESLFGMSGTQWQHGSPRGLNSESLAELHSPHERPLDRQDSYASELEGSSKTSELEGDFNMKRLELEA